MSHPHTYIQLVLTHFNQIVNEEGELEGTKDGTLWYQYLWDKVLRPGPRGKLWWIRPIVNFWGMGVAFQTHLLKFSHQTMLPNLVKSPRYVQGYDTDFLPQVQQCCVLRIYLWSCWFTTASITLLMTESRDIGRYLDGSGLEYFLCTWATEATFHWLAKIPLEKQRFKRWYRGLASSALRSSRTLVGSWSGPEALSGLRPFKSLLMSFGFNVMFSIVHDVDSLNWGTGADASWRWHFCAKAV